MSKEIISEKEIKSIKNPDQYFMNRDPLRRFCEEFLKDCSFVQYLWLLCSFPNLIPTLTVRMQHKINSENLDLTKCNLQHSEDIRLINNLSQLFPNIKKIQAYTRRFNSNVNDILRAFSYFENLEDFDIVFDSVGTNHKLNVGFKNLKNLSITINKREIPIWRKSKYLVHNVLRFTSNLVNVVFSNVLVDGQVFMALNYNQGLKSIELINCKLEIGGRSLFESFLNVRAPQKIFIHELEDESNSKLIEILFKQIPASNKLMKLKEIAFNVYDDETIPYKNIKYCTELKEITLIYFDYITPSFEKIFKEIIDNLRDMTNQFSLNISKVEYGNEIHYNDSYDDILYDFEEYLEGLDIYFGTITFNEYPNTKHH